MDYELQHPQGNAEQVDSAVGSWVHLRKALHSLDIPKVDQDSWQGPARDTYNLHIDFLEQSRQALAGSLNDVIARLGEVSLRLHPALKSMNDLNTALGEGNHWLKPGDRFAVYDGVLDSVYVTKHGGWEFGDWYIESAPWDDGARKRLLGLAARHQRNTLALSQALRDLSAAARSLTGSATSIGKGLLIAIKSGDAASPQATRPPDGDLDPSAPAWPYAPARGDQPHQSTGENLPIAAGSKNVTADEVSRYADRTIAANPAMKGAGILPPEGSMLMLPATAKTPTTSPPEIGTDVRQPGRKLEGSAIGPSPGLMRFAGGAGDGGSTGLGQPNIGPPGPDPADTRGPRIGPPSGTGPAHPAGSSHHLSSAHEAEPAPVAMVAALAGAGILGVGGAAVLWKATRDNEEAIDDEDGSE